MLANMTSAFSLQVENEDLIFTLETLVERFDEEMAPYAVGLTQHLAAAFWRMQVLLPSFLVCPRPCQRHSARVRYWISSPFAART